MFVKVVKFLLWAPAFLVVVFLFSIWVLMPLMEYSSMKMFIDEYISFSWLYAFFLLLLWCVIFVKKIKIDEKWRFMDIILFRSLLIIDFIVLSICLLLMSFSVAWCNARSPWCPNAYSYWEEYVSIKEKFDGYGWFIIPLFLITIILLANADNILKTGYKNLDNTDKNF